MGYKIRTSFLTFIFSISAVILSSSSSAFEAGDVGLGVQVGSPRAGISLKLYRENNSAIAASFGWDKDFFQIQADFIKHKMNMITVEVGKLSVYYGGGISFQNRKSEQIGIRAPLGLNYEFDQVPTELFIEIAPTIQIIDGSSFVVNGSLGGRFYF
jgi:hypothetical protein